MIGALCVAVVLLGVYIGSSYFSAGVGTFITHRSGRNVAFEGKIEAHLWSHRPRITIRNIRVGNAEWSDTPMMFEADRISFSIQPWELLRGRIVLPELIVDRPVLMLEKNEQGAANWDFVQNPQAEVLKQSVPSHRFTVPVIGELQITDGQLHYRDASRNIDTQMQISTIEGEAGAGSAITLTGKGNYQKKPFSLDFNGASILQLREIATPYPFTLHLVIGPTQADVKGTVQNPVTLDALDVVLNLKGANAADLFPITGIALPPTPPYHVEGHLIHDRENWNFNDFKGVMGSSDVRGDVVWKPSHDKQPYFAGDFVSQNLDMKDLSGFVGAHKKPLNNDRVIPDVPLDISRMMAMDADVTFHGEHVKAPDVLDDFYMKLALNDGVLTVKPVSFGIAKGNITADITVEGRETPPKIHAEVHFQRLALSRLFASLAAKYGKENVSSGLLGGRASLHGTGKSLHDMLATADGIIGVGMEGGQLSRLLLALLGLDLFRVTGLVLTDSDKPVPIYCVVGHFSVKSGVMQTRALLADTEVTTIRGEGTANLKNEQVDLRLNAYPKEASALSARTPIIVSGTLKHIRAGVDPVALAARGGIAAALGALLTPIGALLAFVEPGLGEDSHCAAFIKRLERSTGGKIPHNK